MIYLNELLRISQNHQTAKPCSDFCSWIQCVTTCVLQSMRTYTNAVFASKSLVYFHWTDSLCRYRYFGQWQLIFVTHIPVLSCLCLSVHLFVSPFICLFFCFPKNPPLAYKMFPIFWCFPFILLFVSFTNSCHCKKWLICSIYDVQCSHNIY